MHPASMCAELFTLPALVCPVAEVEEEHHHLQLCTVCPSPLRFAHLSWQDEHEAMQSHHPIPCLVSAQDL